MNEVNLACSEVRWLNLEVTHAVGSAAKDKHVLFVVSRSCEHTVVYL